MADNPLLKAVFAFIFICLPVSAFAAAATPVAPVVSPGCDPEFYDVLEARTWAEAEREYEIAGRLILKPDSVLEYSCFNARMNELGSLSGDLDSFINMLAREPATVFLTDNYGHTLGGGTYTGASPVCGAMNAVWNYLKCQDFNRNLFITLKDIVGQPHMGDTDPRTVAHQDGSPPPEPPCPDPGARQARWASQIAAAFPVPAIPAEPGGVDLATHYNQQLQHIGAGCSEATAVPTGTQVLINGAQFDDAVCSVPGCSYGSGGCN